MSSGNSSLIFFKVARPLPMLRKSLSVPNVGFSFSSTFIPGTERRESLSYHQQQSSASTWHSPTNRKLLKVEKKLLIVFGVELSFGIDCCHVFFFYLPCGMPFTSPLTIAKTNINSSSNAALILLTFEHNWLFFFSGSFLIGLPYLNVFFFIRLNWKLMIWLRNHQLDRRPRGFKMTLKIFQVHLPAKNLFRLIHVTWHC